MSRFIIIGLTPQGLALLRLLSRASHQVVAFSNSKNAVSFYSKYGEKILFSDAEDLKRKISAIVGKSDKPVKCIIASGELLALVLEEYPELYDICEVESGPYNLVKMLSYKNLMYDFAKGRGLITAKFCLLSEFDQYYEEPGYSHNQFLTDCIISTSLFNFSFPLIRYRVNDIVAVDHNGAVREIEGCYEEFVVCNNGIKIGRLDHIFKGVKGIRFAQILQKVPSHIEINIVPESCLGLNTTSQIEGKLREKVSSDNLCATFNSITVNDLIYSSRNKLSLVKSYL